MNESPSGASPTSDDTFVSGLKRGLREGPLVFATPLIAIWRGVSATTSSLLASRSAAIHQA